MSESTPAAPKQPTPAPARRTGPPAQHDGKGHLTRAGMEQVIAGSGSVGYRGKLITSVSGLPTEADLAKGDPAAEAAALERLDEQQRDLDAQRAKLSKPTAVK